jgi:hypothetical protein
VPAAGPTRRARPRTGLGDRALEEAADVARIDRHRGADRRQPSIQRELVGRQQVPPPEVERIEPELVGGEIEEPFACEGPLVATRATVGPARGSGGEHHVRGASVRGHAVRTWQHAA